MAAMRQNKLNSLLKQVLTEVIRKDVRNPLISTLFTVTSVDISKDLHHAKVYISVIGTPEVKQQTIDALESAAGFIAIQASKEVVMRYFPSLTFKLDETVDKHMKIDALLGKINHERENRHPQAQAGNEE